MSTGILKRLSLRSSPAYKDPGDDWEALARTTDPETSHDAIPAAEARRAIEDTMLLAHYRALKASMEAWEAGDVDSYYKGFTDYEIMCECGYSLAQDGHRRRHSSLREKGYLEFVEIAPGTGIYVTRTSPASRVGRRVSMLTDKGLERAKKLSNEQG